MNPVILELVGMIAALPGIADPDMQRIALSAITSNCTALFPDPNAPDADATAEINALALALEIATKSALPDDPHAVMIDKIETLLEALRAATDPVKAQQILRQIGESCATLDAHMTTGRAVQQAM